MDGNGRRYGRWWDRRGLLLAGTAVLGLRLGLAFGARCGISTMISTSSSRSSGSAGSRGGATRRRCLRGLVVGVYILRRFPFLRGDTRGVSGV